METINENWNTPQPPFQPNNLKVASGICAILLGPFGVHKFILGYTTEGIIYLVISLCTCGIASSIMGIIEGVIYLVKSDEEFYHTYQVNKRPWF